MHTLMVAERFWPAIGGVERHLAGLLPALAARGHELVLVAPAHQAGLPARATFAAGVTVYRLPYTGRRRRDYLAAWRWWSAQRGVIDGAARLHFHDTYSLLQWFGPAHRLAAGKPRFMTFHGYEMRYPVPRRARLYRRLAARLAPRYLCVGHFLAKWFGLRPAAVTYGAVSPAPALPRPAEPGAVFIGRLDADTGLDIYLAALVRLRREYGQELPLQVCGDGPWRARLQAQAQAAALPVEFLGFVEQPAPILAGAGLAFVSGYLAILEALAARRPVFSVYHTPVKEDYLRLIPGSDAMIQVAGDAAALAAQLAAHLAQPAAATARIDHGAAFAAAHSWDALADLYESLWSNP